MGKEYPEKKVRDLLAAWADKCVSQKFLPAALVITSWSTEEACLGLISIDKIGDKDLVDLFEQGLELAKGKV